MLITDKLLLSYQRCNLRAFLDTCGDWKQQDPPSDFLLKLMRDSATYQKETLESESYQQPSYPRGDWAAGAAATLSLMQQGVDRIYRGVLCQGELGKTNGETDSILGIERQYLPDIGEIPETPVHLCSSILHSSEITLVSRPHLLIKQPGNSKFGDWSYATADIWLSKRPKLDYQIIAAFHAHLLASVQGTMPEKAWLMLRTKGLWAVNLHQRMPQMFEVLDECIKMLESKAKPEVFISRQKCTLCNWYSTCHQEAESIQHLSLLPGVTAKRYATLKVLGLTDLESLANANSDLLASYPEFVAGVAVDVVQQARSTFLNQPFVREEGRRKKEEGRREEGSENYAEDRESEIVPNIADNILNNIAIEKLENNGSRETGFSYQNTSSQPADSVKNHVSVLEVDKSSRPNKQAKLSVPPPILRQKPIPYSQSVFLPIAPIELYFDIEAEPELNLDYLHGVLVVDRYNKTEKYYQFLAESAAEEGVAWSQFLELMWSYPIAPIFHFCDYEIKTFKRLAKLYKTPVYLWKPVLKRFVDIHKYVTQKAIMPVESYALKPIARWLGFEWRDAKANGAQCVCWYDDWLKTGDRSLLEAIVRYNEDDCRATYVVKDWLTNFLLNHEP
ncbi:MAG: TM0106 family RecB-like putative nuclease [Oscillatoriales cyanobacterium]|uniref:TM0106 family RecB-like putative nuclease n=1 Tax=Microcoleus anatoxicus TaxID=2705319 RepID=UPI002970714E|nr:MAG: TM0106 family RecB-like putative nuclease [Oscillatoriales cyanobacterium]TAF69746.1 MAG: TM0106 family RecB-like putative nuclease [Oscillatoriales cyanobacterium]